MTAWEQIVLTSTLAEDGGDAWEHLTHPKSPIRCVPAPTLDIEDEIRSVRIQDVDRVLVTDNVGGISNISVSFDEEGEPSDKATITKHGSGSSAGIGITITRDPNES